MNQFQSSVSNRLTWVDYAKGIAIILVVYRHILVGIERSGIPVDTYLKVANEVVYSFRMPLFFILSGMFISRTMEKYLGVAFVKLKSKTILYPYLVWGVIQISIQIILSNYTNSQRSLIDYSYLITNPRAIDQLWYLLALFNSTILFFLFRFTFKFSDLIITLLAVLFYGASVWLENYSLVHDIFYYFIFLVLGHLCRSAFLKEKYQKYFKSPTKLLLALPLMLITQWYWLNHQDLNVFLFMPITLIGCYVVYSVSFILAERNWLPMLTFVGKHSLQIYLMHLLVVSMIRMVMIKIFNIHSTIPILLTCWVLGIVIPIVAYTILKKTPAIVLFEPSFKAKRN
jgi:fucose 4-O-acetylase-like acetyltransferase